jgi:outer membrane protein
MALEQGIREAKSGRLPTLSLSGGAGTSYSSQRSELLPDMTRQKVPFSDQLADNRSGSMSLSLSIPLFDRFATRTNVHRAKISYENSQLDLDNLRQNVALEVRQAYLDYQTAAKRLDVTEIQLRSAQQAEAVEQERYNVGASTLVELTQARATLVDSESQRAQAIFQFVFQSRVIDYYLGVLNPTDLVLPAQ